MQQAWGPHQRAGGMNAFPQAQGTNISGCQAFRNQGGGNMSEMPQQRRSSGIPPNFPQQPSQYNNQQFSPNSQRYMMGAGQVRPGQMNQPYGQQQMPGQFGPNQMVFNQVMSGSQVVHQQQPTPQQPPQPPGPSPPGHSPQAPLPNPQPPTSVSQQPTQTPQSQPSPQPPPPPHTSQPSPMQNQSPQHNQQNSPQNANRSHGKKSSDDSEGMEQNTFDEINAENTRGSQGTPTPSGGLHPGVSNLRVTPSPAGSTGSRSNTPASITGNRASSPMPPRPPSSQLDGQIPQSQMSNQGFGQHIMPPPVGPNQMYNTGNKPMAGMNAVAASASQMGGHFSQYNSQFPGNTATMVTQAITAPVTSVVESMSNDSQQDLLSTYSISPMVNSTSTGAPMSADEPPEKKKKDCVSHPPTPTNLSQSPSGTSVSSYPEEIENLNSPTSWSVGTPKPSQSADLHKLYTMGDEPDRKMFLDRLLYFLEEKGSPITSMPQISKQPLDLYKLYHSVKEKGGMVEVNKAKKWKEICAVVNIGSSASAAFTLKKNYVKYLFALECKYDKGGIDPAPILAQMEAAMQQKRESKQRRAPSPAGSQGSSQDAFRPPSTPNSNSQGMDPFSPNMQPYMGGPNSEPNMGPMGSGMLPHGSMMNSMNPSNNMMGQNSVGGPNSGMLPPHHMSSGPNSMHGSMMPGNMPPSNNMMGNSYAPNSMMPNNMGPNNSMMPNNMGSSSNNMLGNNMGPSNNNLASNMTQPAPPPQNESDSVSVQDPFADEPCPSGPSYPRQSMNSQMPTYSGMQSQTTMSGAYGFNRQNAQHGMSPYSNMSQQSMNNYSENRIGQNEQYNDAYRRTMGMDNFNSNNRNTENFGPGNNQFGPRNSQGSGAQFPFGQQFDRERFDQPNPVNSNQQFRPPSQPGMVTPQQHPEQMYPSRYGSNQQMNPVRSHTPQHDQYPPQSGYPNQSNTFGSPRGVVPQEQYQNYPNQQSGFGGHRPPTSRDVPAGNMYGTPNKRFPPDVERRENFNMSDSRRDPSQWSAMQQRFGSQHSGTNYPASNMNAMPPGSGMLPPMVPPSPSSTGRTMNPRLSPQREKPYMSPPRVQKPGGMVPNAQLPPKKEISFPPDSVEAVQPLLAKRKRLAKQDIGQTEPWKLMMALKSGMLAESTWALDTLSILLFDDSTVTYFTLSHLPGLLEVLLEHFRRCLIDMFGLFNELEVGYDAVLVKQKEKEGSLKSFKVMDVEDYKNLESDTVWKGMRVGENYTYITRQGKVVKVNENDRETALLDGKQWDIYSGFTSKAEHWQLGGGDMSTHVQTHFESLNNHKIFKKLFYYRGMKKDCQDEIVNNVMPLKLSYRLPEPAEHASDRENSSFKTSPPPADHKSVNGVVDSENLHNCINKIHIKKEPVEDEEKENAARTRVGTQSTDSMDVATPAAAVSDHVCNFSLYFFFLYSPPIPHFHFLLLLHWRSI
ncbi:ARID1 [Acanthosepion pharaonis]|uniref:ARID1 n=1 Tax=Acanthosepion pharaonis TaxID=158019 RepID=A0A812C7I9_ACAPH|nr:ARID1 [Sepia pharaonis]